MSLADPADPLLSMRPTVRPQFGDSVAIFNFLPLMGYGMGAEERECKPGQVKNAQARLRNRARRQRFRGLSGAKIILRSVSIFKTSDPGTCLFGAFSA